jgi:hypothetical protein
MYIPVLNIFNIFIWLYLCITEFVHDKTSTPTLTIFFTTGVPFLMFRIIVPNDAKLLLEVASFLFSYFFPLFFSMRILKYANEITKG